MSNHLTFDEAVNDGRFLLRFLMQGLETGNLSQEQALRNGEKIFAKIKAKGITGADVTLLRAYKAIVQAEYIIRSCPEDAPLPARILGTLAKETQQAVIRTWTFKGPGKDDRCRDARFRALKEIEFRLSVIQQIFNKLGYDMGDTEE